MIDLMKVVGKKMEEETNLYLVELTLRDRMLGTQPRSKDVLVKWLESQKDPEGKKLDPAIIEHHVSQFEAAADQEEKLSEKADAAWTTFFFNENGPWVGTYQVKACIREMLTTLGITVAKRGSKQTYQHLMEVVSCDAKGKPHTGRDSGRLYFYRDDGERVSEPDGFVEMTGNVQTAQGPRSIIKRHDYIEMAKLRFVVRVAARLQHNRASAVLGDEEIASIFAHAGDNGLGCSRSQGFGRFDTTKLTRLTDNPTHLKKPSKDED